MNSEEVRQLPYAIAEALQKLEAAIVDFADGSACGYTVREPEVEAARQAVLDAILTYGRDCFVKGNRR